MSIKSLAVIAAVIVSACAQAADEITVSAAVTLNSGAVSQSQKSGDIKLDLLSDTPAYNSSLLTLNTSWQALPVGGVTSNGNMWVKNADTNEWIQSGVTNPGGRWMVIGVTNAGAAIAPFAKMFSGECGLIPVDPGAALFFKACTSGVPAQVFLITR